MWHYIVLIILYKSSFDCKITIKRKFVVERNNEVDRSAWDIYLHRRFVIDIIYCLLPCNNLRVLVSLTSPVADPRWNIVPDGEGKFRIVDINTVEFEPEPAFNPEVDTAFLLFTGSNPTGGQRITWTTESISNSNFNPNHPVRILIHGWNSGPGSGVNIAPTRAYLQRGNFNVIV